MMKNSSHLCTGSTVFSPMKQAMMSVPPEIEARSTSALEIGKEQKNKMCTQQLRNFGRENAIASSKHHSLNNRSTQVRV